ncbi:hypothetical protein FQZ97_698000 [compost metagenome]
MLQTLQDTQIGHHADVGFLDAELSGLRSETQITSGNQVETGTHASALHGGNHRKARTLQRIQRVLHLLQAGLHGFPLYRVGGVELLGSSEYLQVQPTTEHLALG